VLHNVEVKIDAFRRKQDFSRPCIGCDAANARGTVELGIDVLKVNGYTLLKNKHVGLITNQTGVDSRGVRTRILLRKNCNLVALYTSQHRLDGGEKAGRCIRFRRDPVTGLTAHSLYGPTRGIGPGGIVASWTPDLVRFKGERSQYLIY